ncbi:hypothetical protein DFH27DRAFT_186748 [Peziza echinospora]|nr:hypothetical protein DFH27DRAFT_186748 [Peziza echinospora]
MSVASKNLFELLGNDPDSDGEIKPPPREIVKQTMVTKKKDVVVETPPPAAAARSAGRGGRGRNTSGTDAAFRDNNAGREYNRSKDTAEGGEAPRHTGRGRGGRGGRTYDRHSQTGRVDTEKKVSQGWGSDDKEWTEEKAGESIAQAEASSENVAVAAGEPEVVGEAEVAAAAEEPEEKLKTYQDYLAEVAAKKEALNPLPQARQPNEGSRTDSKWKNAVPVKKSEEDSEAYFAGKEAKARKERERKQKVVVEIDQRFQEAPRQGGRGGSERGGRGGRGGAERGERRGGPRGGRGGQEGGFRGGERRGGFAPRNNAGPTVNLADPSAFPSLGSK